MLKFEKKKKSVAKRLRIMFDSLVCLGSSTSIAVQIRILKPNAVSTEVSTLLLVICNDNTSMTCLSEPYVCKWK